MMRKKTGNSKPKMSKSKSIKKPIDKLNKTQELSEQLTPLAQMVVNAYDAAHSKSKSTSLEDTKRDLETLKAPIEKTHYRLTPKGILFAILSEVYSIDGNMQKFEYFMNRLMTALSLLSTDGQTSCAFGKDFNDFFETFVTTMNLCGCLKKKLDENGVEVDVQKLIQELMLGPNGQHQ